MADPAEQKDIDKPGIEAAGMSETQQIFLEVEAERKTQDTKWGKQNHVPSAWLSILGEEYGEACEAANENKLAEYRDELIQTAAVAVAMIECVDRFNKGGVYLAGPIKGCTEKDIHEWREHCSTKLNCKTINPALRNFNGSEFNNKDCMNEIVNPDKNEINSSSVLLANCWQISVGTSMEILYAWERDKLIVLVVPKGDIISAWIVAHSHKIFHSLNDAIDYINGI